MAFPPAHLLVGAGVGELLRTPAPLPRWRAWIGGAFFALLPDIDTMLLFAIGERAPNHGVYTHSLLAVLVVAIGVWAVLGPRWSLLAGGAYASHLLVDLLRAGSTNVYPAGPFIREPAQGIYPLFPGVPFEAGGGVLGEAPSFYGADPLGRMLEQTLIGAGFFLAALVISALLRGRPPRSRARALPSPPRRRGSRRRRR